MDEILGISRSGTSTPYPPTSVPDTPSELSAHLGLQELTTSSKSVMDYFKEKLQAKSDAKTALVSTSSSPRTVEIDDRPEEDARTTGGLGFHAGIGSSSRHAPQSDENDTPRFGLGSFSRAMAMSSTPVFSKSTPELPVPLQSTENDDGRTLVGEEEESNVEPQKKEKKSKTSKIVEQTEPETAAPKAEKKRKDKKARRKAKEDERSEQSPRRTPVDDVAIGEADPDRDLKSRSDDSLVHVENVVGEVGGECDSNSKRSKKKRKKHRDSETCLE